MMPASVAVISEVYYYSNQGFLLVKLISQHIMSACLVLVQQWHITVSETRAVKVLSSLMVTFALPTNVTVFYCLCEGIKYEGKIVQNSFK